MPASAMRRRRWRCGRRTAARRARRADRRRGRASPAWRAPRRGPTCAGVPPSISVAAPAAMPAAAPVSAWHPPSAPESDARSATTAPMRPARRERVDHRLVADARALRARPVSTAGSTPAPPAVGAATITPIAAFTSCTASARASTSRNSVPASGPARTGDELGRVAAHEAGRRAQIARRARAPPRRASPSSARRSASRISSTGRPWSLRLELERESREREARALRRRGWRRRASCTCSAAHLVERGAPSAPSRARDRVARAASPGGSSHSMTMNASPPRSFRVRRSVAMLTCCSARIAGDARDRPSAVLGDEHDGVAGSP